MTTGAYEPTDSGRQHIVDARNTRAEDIGVSSGVHEDAVAGWGSDRTDPTGVIVTGTGEKARNLGDPTASTRKNVAKRSVFAIAPKLPPDEEALANAQAAQNNRRAGSDAEADYARRAASTSTPEPVPLTAMIAERPRRSVFGVDIDARTGEQQEATSALPVIAGSAERAPAPARPEASRWRKLGVAVFWAGSLIGGLLGGAGNTNTDKIPLPGAPDEFANPAPTKAGAETSGAIQAEGKVTPIIHIEVDSDGRIVDDEVSAPRATTTTPSSTTIPRTATPPPATPEAAAPITEKGDEVVRAAEEVPATPTTTTSGDEAPDAEGSPVTTFPETPPTTGEPPAEEEEPVAAPPDAGEPEAPPQEESNIVPPTTGTTTPSGAI